MIKIREHRNCGGKMYHRLSVDSEWWHGYQKRERNGREAPRAERQWRGPTTDYGKAVAETEFGRVCPKCGARWSAEPKWYGDTIGVGTEWV